MNIKEFIKQAYEHKIPSSHNRTILGIFLELLGWLLISICSISHELPLNSSSAMQIDYSFQMLIATITLLVISIAYGCTIGHGLRGYRLLKICRESEVLKNGAVNQLSYGGRIFAIYLRAFIATSGYLLFQFARSLVNVIDNSVFHGADALAYVCLYGRWLEKQEAGKSAYSRPKWWGIYISFGAVILAFVYELMTSNFGKALEGVSSGLVSSVMLATIILLSSILVYHDSVIRIAFHNCAFAFIMTMIIILLTTHGSFSEISYAWKFVNFKSAASVGVAYAVALLCFLYAYRCIEPVFIAILGNSLGLWTILISVFFIRGHFNYWDVFLTLLLSIGSIILGIQEWRKNNSEGKTV